MKFPHCHHSIFALLAAWATFTLGLQPLATAEIPRTPKDHAEIASLLEEVQSEDQTVRSGAIASLGYWDRADVTEMLIQLLRKQIDDEKAWKGGLLCTKVGDMRAYLKRSPENLVIANTLVRQKAVQSLPVLKDAYASCLGHDSEERRRVTKNLVSAIYSLSGEILPLGTDKDAEPFKPLNWQTEEMRILVRPDLRPTGGLTLQMEFSKNGIKPHMFVRGAKELAITATLTNLSDHPIPIELAPESFAILRANQKDYVALEMSRLPVPVGKVGEQQLLPGKTAKLTWEISQVNASDLKAVLSENSYSYLKMVYLPHSEQSPPNWQAAELQSNTLHPNYFPQE